MLASGASPQGSPPTQNDAGSGMDAGDTPDLALLVSGARHAWSANLTPPGSDSDWYRRAATGAFCAEASASTNSPGELVLAAGGSLENAVRRPVDKHDPSPIALAAPAGSEPYFGLRPMSMVQLLGGNSGPPSPGRYTFDFDARTLADLDPEGDGESPDAGSTLATSAPLPLGCAAGRLSTGDTEDRYHIDITDPIELGFSFALASGGSASARVVSPSGATVATLESGDAVDVWANEAGRWVLIVTAQAAPTLPAASLGRHGLLPETSGATVTTDYLLGTTGGPDPEPCRPTCR